MYCDSLNVLDPTMILTVQILGNLNGPLQAMHIFECLLHLVFIVSVIRIHALIYAYLLHDVLVAYVVAKELGIQGAAASITL